MSETIFKALFSAARVAAKTLVMQPHILKANLARKAAHAAANVIGRAVGKAAASSWSTVGSASSSKTAFADVLSRKAPRSGAGGAAPFRRGR